MLVSALTVRFRESEADLQLLRASLDAAAHHAGVDLEFLVWNNGGEFELQSSVASIHTDGEQRYHSGGINRLAQNAEGEMLLIVQPDMVLGRNCLKRMILSASNSRLTLVEGRQIPFDHPKSYDLVTGSTSWASGALMLLKRSMFLKLNGFAEDVLPMYCNDVDLSWRWRAAGGEVVLDDEAKGFHPKRVHETGTIYQSEYERHNSVLAQLTLAHRWGAKRFRAKLIRSIRSSGDHVLLKQLARFKSMESSGLISTLPQHIRVFADFRGFDIGESRF